MLYELYLNRVNLTTLEYVKFYLNTSDDYLSSCILKQWWLCYSCKF